MSDFSRLERFIARFLARSPGLKKKIKSAYAKLMFLIYQKNYRYKTDFSLKHLDLKNESSFFGYYDKCPENRNGQVLICVTSSSSKKNPRSDLPLELNVVDNGNIVFKTSSYSYNWQQGCRAHWLSDDLFIFNDFSNEYGYISRVFSISKKTQVKFFDRPVQDSFKTDYFISLNYRRLMSLRPDYGYRNISAANIKELSDLDSDGLWHVDYDSGQSRLLISISDACKLGNKKEFKDALHKFNHVLISPNGEGLIFMHRYLIGKRRFDRLLFANSVTGEIKILADYGMISHCFWVNNDNVMGYMRGPDFKDGYWFIDVNSGAFRRFYNAQIGLYGDGHPHVNGDWFVTDSYPDKSRMQHLILCNWKTGETKKIGEFFHSFEFEGESRCDLHPRFSVDGKSVFFDSVFSGKRKLYKLENVK